ncbi:hypothetical protein H072_8292 [Dactylellina haptotyla CBS 200.50]|uniref:Uncharacterized protein n=1 Tax=Dactylellina haptotyla (strain CBS 200.50) TaxID=1284197 RepID=S8A5F7_DACHA|nr:hypothetical protein H072_8292 [Dactylellina haptotyla CBS 200.50]
MKFTTVLAVFSAVTIVSAAPAAEPQLNQVFPAGNSKYTLPPNHQLSGKLGEYQKDAVNYFNKVAPKPIIDAANGLAHNKYTSWMTGPHPILRPISKIIGRQEYELENLDG